MEDRLRELERRFVQEFPGAGGTLKVNEALLSQYVQMRQRTDEKKPFKYRHKIPFYEGDLYASTYYDRDLRQHRNFTTKKPLPEQTWSRPDGIVQLDNYQFFDALKFVSKAKRGGTMTLYIFESVTGKQYYIFERYFHQYMNYMFYGWLIGDFAFIKNSNVYGVQYLNCQKKKKRKKK